MNTTVNNIGNGDVNMEVKVGDIVIISHFNSYLIGMVQADMGTDSELRRITFDGRFGYDINQIFVVGKIDASNFPNDDKALAKLKQVFRDGRLGYHDTHGDYEKARHALVLSETPPVSADDFIVVVVENGAGETHLELGKVIRIETGDDYDMVEFRGRFRNIKDVRYYKRPVSFVIPIKLPAEIADSWYVE